MRPLLGSRACLFYVIGRAHDHKHASPLVRQADVRGDPIGPDVDITLGRTVSLAPGLVLFLPDLLQAHDGRSGEPRGPFAKQAAQRFAEVAARDSAQVQPRD